MVELFGRFTQVAQPGCHILPPCYGLGGSVSLRIQQLDVKCETKTKDNVFVHILCSVQYQVIPDQVYTAYYTLVNPQSQIEHYIFDVVRSTVPQIDLDELFETKDEIARTVRSELRKVMEDYGFEILQALVTDIDPAPKVKNAMNAINEAKRLREAAIHKAEANKISVVKNAEADAESKALAGQGIARQRLAVVNGLQESILQFSEDVGGATAKDALDLVLITQYFDALQSLGNNPNVTTVFVPNTDVAGGEESSVRNGVLAASAGNPITRKNV
eukprot:CAMPEP_0119133180 /NCGR_PEP_ID=MMETSP1310-20130426/13200_1 /TAXON_ID=464262 /ORGANISM="Genus nov. species nov., Strain RCC2339" /LENGTH=273 /DNA_ID=CAMNT_0007123865 /DNA_START=178 /DNA_END=999 /DNA_ORIENTATION=+